MDNPIHLYVHNEGIFFVQRRRRRRRRMLTTYRTRSQKWQPPRGANYSIRSSCSFRKNHTQKHRESFSVHLNYLRPVSTILLRIFTHRVVKVDSPYNYCWEQQLRSRKESGKEISHHTTIIFFSPFRVLIAQSVLLRSAAAAAAALEANTWRLWSVPERQPDPRQSRALHRRISESDRNLWTGYRITTRSLDHPRVTHFRLTSYETIDGTIH